MTVIMIMMITSGREAASITPRSTSWTLWTRCLRVCISGPWRTFPTTSILPGTTPHQTWHPGGSSRTDLTRDALQVKRTFRWSILTWSWSSRWCSGSWTAWEEWRQDSRDWSGLHEPLSRAWLGVIRVWGDELLRFRWRHNKTKYFRLRLS